MTTLTTIPQLAHPASLDYEWDLPHDDDTPGLGDPLTSLAHDVNKHRRSIETLEEGNRSFCEELLTMKRRLHELEATITDVVTAQTFNRPDDDFF